MTNLIPSGEVLPRAIRWISEEHRERPERTLGQLVDEAALRFDLSPGQQEWLHATLTRGDVERPIP